MPNKLDSFVADCREALKSQPGTPGREKVKDLVKQVLADPEFDTVLVFTRTKYGADRVARR